MPVTLATTAQLRDHLQNADLDEQAAARAIASASALVRAVARQSFDFVAGDTVTLAGGEREIVLPQRPVIVNGGNPLTVVELGDVDATGVPAVEGRHFRRVGSRLIKANRSRHNAFIGAEHIAWPPGLWAPWVQVTYSHGYATDADVPAELTTVVLDTAATYASNPEGLRAISLDGEVTLTYGTESLQAPKDLVDNLRARLRGIGVRRGGAFSVTPG
jgi:hypothetical protein